MVENKITIYFPMRESKKIGNGVVTVIDGKMWYWNMFSMDDTNVRLPTVISLLEHIFDLWSCSIDMLPDYLAQVDPSGSYFSWKASAIGKNVSNAKTFLEKRLVDSWLFNWFATAILTWTMRWLIH